MVLHSKNHNGHSNTRVADFWSESAVVVVVVVAPFVWFSFGHPFT
jgi:low affinity Fe/Cu permease